MSQDRLGSGARLACRRCGGFGWFSLVYTYSTDPKANTDTNFRFVKVACRCCDGRGGICGCPQALA